MKKKNECMFRCENTKVSNDGLLKTIIIILKNKFNINRR